jgi:glycosyltransferase involved in cell wall biosynthesis
VVIEANRCGTPVVGYDVRGLEDSIINGKTGILVKDGDVKKLAEVISNLLNDEETRKKLSRNALEWSKKFSWDKSAEEFESVIRHA